MQEVDILIYGDRIMDEILKNIHSRISLVSILWGDETSGKLKI